jgi:hypothetical protein
MQFTRRTLAILTLTAVAAFLLVVARGDLASAGPGGGKYNSMTQSKKVQACTAQTTLEKVADKSEADPGDTITYTVTETNNAEGSCILDDGGTLRVVGTYALENRSGAGSDNTGSPCGVTDDPRDTCVTGVLDWVEYHLAGEGANWHALHVDGGEPSDTHSGNPQDGHNGLDWYCPSDSTGALPAPYGSGKCSDTAQPLYGVFSMTDAEDGAVSAPFALPCGKGAGSSCFDAKQTYTYNVTVSLTPEQADLLASADGIRNVVHLDMFNEEVSNSGRNHFARASFTYASLDSNAYNVTITDSPKQAPGEGDFCTPSAPFTRCVQSGSSWVADAPDGATLASGASGTVQVEYKVRDDDCGMTIGNVANATHTDASDEAVSIEGPAEADTTIGACAPLYSSRTQGFWQGQNGEEKLDADADTILDTTVSIGDGSPGSPGSVGATVTKLAESQVILPGGSKESRCLALTGNSRCLPGSAQFARPDSDFSLNGWSSPAFSKINEVTADDDTNYTSRTGVGTLEVDTSNLADPVVDSGHILRFRARTSGTVAGQPEKLNMELWQGGTKIGDTGDKTLTGSYQTFTDDLTTTEAAAITDYTNLRFKFVPTLAGTETVRLTWAELEVPPAGSMDEAVITQLMGAAPQTLGLTYNCVYLNSGNCSATLSSIDPCETNPDKDLASVSGALSTLGLDGSTTVQQVLDRANLEIQNSNSSTNLAAVKGLMGGFVNCDRGADPPGDEDWDGVLDVVDNCVGANNPDQSDLDGDGIGDPCDFEADGDSGGVTVGGFDAFSDLSEAYMGTDPQRDCGLDAWGPDFNGDWTVDIFDVAEIKAHFATAVGNPAYTPRDDLSTDGYINIVDLAVMKRFFFQTCAGVDPIQPGAP